jgi:hypothetical protein
MNACLERPHPHLGQARIRAVRRRSAILLLAVLAALAGLRLSAAAADSEALRCAVACGHAATLGAACCPMSDAAGKEAAMAACPRSDPQSAAPTMPAPLAIPTALHRLAAPLGASALASIASVAPRSPSTRPPDHVPLLLS